jgi:cellulose synthase/poly-beta-1,6-N-acetylglucosamine synthase-like glycosyltransferase
LYVPTIDCASELPVEMNSFKTQQARWAKGLMQTAKKILPQVMRSNEPKHIKAEAFFHLTANISYPLMIVLSTMLLPAMIVRFYQGMFQMVFIDLPLFLAASCSIGSFYLVAQRSLNPKGWRRAIWYVPFVMAVGIGISVRNSIAVMEAIFGKQSEFARTPKHGIQGQKGGWVKQSYRNRSGWLPFIEIGLGLYFILTTIYATVNRNYATVPFLLLFVWGYLYTGLMSVGQTWFERLRLGRAQAPASTPSAEPHHAATGAQSA